MLAVRCNIQFHQSAQQLPASKISAKPHQQKGWDCEAIFTETSFWLARAEDRILNSSRRAVVKDPQAEPLSKAFIWLDLLRLHIAVLGE